jgi:integrase
MSLYKRGGVWWLDGWFEGKRYQVSTKHANKKKAKTFQDVFFANLADERAGIVKRKPAPLFSDFAKRFVEHFEVRHDNKPQTVVFYATKLSRLLEFPALALVRLDKVDESLIEQYVISRRASVGPATVNRELATLRRLLRLAHEWKELDRVPRVRLLSGERSRDFVLNRQAELLYLSCCAQPLHDLALLILETGLRIGEALSLEWADVSLQPLSGARFGYLRVRDGKSKNARRTIPLTDRAALMLHVRHSAAISPLVFANREGQRYLVTSINHLHQKARTALKLPKDFVIHSLRHTMLTRLGESGVDAFTIMRIAGHSSITVSQRYVHPSPEAVERAFERLQLSGSDSRQESKVLLPPTKVPTVGDAVSVSH